MNQGIWVVESGLKTIRVVFVLRLSAFTLLLPVLIFDKGYRELNAAAFPAIRLHAVTYSSRPDPQNVSTSG